MTAQQLPKFRTVIWTLIKRQPLRYAFAQFLWISIWTMPILVGLLIGFFFDELAAGIEPTTVTSIVLVLAVYTVVRATIIVLAMRNHGSMLFRAAAMMRRNMLMRLYELPGAESLDETPGEIVSRMRDDVEHVVEPFDLTVDLAGAAVAGAVSFGLLFAIDPVVTVVIAVPVVIVAFVSHTTGGIVRRYRREARETTEAITGFLGETFSATQSVKVAGAEQTMLDRFMKLNGERKVMMVRDRTLTEALHAVFRNTVNIGTGLILLLAAGRMSATGDAGISIGEFATFVFLLHHVTEASYFFGVYTARAKQGSVSIERITKTLHGEPWSRAFAETDTGLDDESGSQVAPRIEPPDFESLSVRGLSYTYPGSTNGIEDFNLDIRKGEFVVITGRIGAGKTTALRTILGLLPAHGGTIDWNGHAVEDASRELVPPLAAYTPQVPKLFSMSLRDNLILGEEVTDHVMDESIYIATMRHDVDLMPEGLETMVGPRGVRLSGGQIQRSASARMLTRDPQLLVLDDVSSALDVETEQILWTRLFNAREHVAALVVSHRHAALARADRVIVMEGGRVVATGTAAELQENSDVFRAIWQGAKQAATPA